MQVQSNVDAILARLPVIGQFVNSVSLGNLLFLVILGYVAAVAFGYAERPWVGKTEFKAHAQRLDVQFKIMKCEHLQDSISKKRCWSHLRELVTPLDNDERETP